MSHAQIRLLFFLTLILVVHNNPNDQPNIVFVLTDDQDVEIGGMTPMEKTKKLIGDAGAIFQNAFVTSPLCCPSRSSILTGNYVHNNGALNNSVSGNCSSPEWQRNSESNAFVTVLKKHGYKTFFAGKYLNQYGFHKTGGVEHVPNGWDDWNGLVGNSVYYNYTLSANGKPEVHGDTYPEDYLTEVIGVKARNFLMTHSSADSPFFMMLSLPACHAPFTPADRYRNNFSDISAPRNGSFNQYSKNKHWLLRNVKHPMGSESIKVIDDVYRNRWRTLLSVDDLVEQILKLLDEMMQLDNTYVIFSSDNGYHLGQLSLPYDKRQMYEFDIRVPLMIRGPNIKPGQIRPELVLNIDFAPTFLDLAGISSIPFEVDGQSWKHLVFFNDSVIWRKDFLVEHYGEIEEIVPGCPSLSHQGLSNCYPDCVCEDSYNNTFHCLRTISVDVDLVYCEFVDDERFVEVYDLRKDPFELNNIAEQLGTEILLDLKKRMFQLLACVGSECR